MAPPIDTKKGGFYETQQPKKGKKGGIITIYKAPPQGFPNSLHAKTSVFFSPSTPSKMKKSVINNNCIDCTRQTRSCNC
jgi:hypothetical protein